MGRVRGGSLHRHTRGRVRDRRLARPAVQQIPGDCLRYGTSFQGLVTDGASFYYAESGDRLGSAPVPRPVTNRISTDGRFVAFAVGKTVRVLDLETAALRIVNDAASEPVGLSVVAGRLVWGENTSGRSRIVSAAARPA